MKDMERQAFEDAWKDAFDKAEISPSENIWTNIELDLEKAAGEKMRRSVLFYKLMAAASITFAMCVAGVGAFYYKNINNPSGYVASNSQRVTDHSVKQLPTEKSQDQKGSASQEITSSLEHSDDAADGQQQNSAKSQQVRVKAGRAFGNDARQLSNTDFKNQYPQSQVSNEIAFGENANVQNSLTDNNKDIADLNNSDDIGKQDGASESEIVVVQKPALTSLLASKKVIFKGPQKDEVDPFIAMMARLEQRERELRADKKSDKQKQNKSDNQNVWASMGFAAGSFSSSNSNVNTLESRIDKQQTNYSYSASSSTYNSDVKKEVVRKQCKASGDAYSFGLSLGTNISKRWILQGGVNYLNQTSAYATSLMATEGENEFSLYTLKDAASRGGGNNSQTSAPYDVNYSMEYISVPVQAGFIIGSRHKLGLQLNTGVSTDLFLKSVARAIVNDTHQSVREGWNSDSPYRTVNFSGLFGAELNYRFAYHYSIALNPGMRYPFGSIYKSEVGVKSMPLTMDLGVKFKYIFR
jgi:hypothetical protein